MLRALQPWISAGADGLQGGVFTVHPGPIPAGDRPRSRGGSAAGPDALFVRGRLVRTVPPCAPVNGASVPVPPGR